MCFINPKFKVKFILEVCTAHGTREDFEEMLDAERTRLVEMEMALNATGKLRWCLTEEEG